MRKIRPITENRNMKYGFSAICVLQVGLVKPVLHTYVEVDAG